jgi:hypothetical protein
MAISYGISMDFLYWEVMIMVVKLMISATNQEKWEFWPTKPQFWGDKTNKSQYFFGTVVTSSLFSSLLDLFHPLKDQRFSNDWPWRVITIQSPDPGGKLHAS